MFPKKCLEIVKLILLQTVQIWMGCHIFWHTVRVCTFCYKDKKNLLRWTAIEYFCIPYLISLHSRPSKMEVSIPSVYKGLTWQPAHRERSGSVVDYLTRDRRAAGSSLTGVTALCP